MNKLYDKKAFTLVEVLIVIAVIGIVAAITLPGLTTKLKKKIEEYQYTVMEAKLVQGLNMLSSQENGLNVSYNNTEEFVLALSKYLKMSTICGKDNLKDCFGYDKVNYEKNGNVKQQELDKITTAKNLKLKNENGNEYLDPAGFVLADGTPIIITWNNNCGNLADDNGRMLVDPDKALKSIPVGCIDGLYDRNGTKAPNKYGYDVQPFSAAKLGSDCIKEVGDKCITTKFRFPSAISPSVYCPGGVVKKEYKDMGITKCCTSCGSADYWAGAVQYCHSLGAHLPSNEEILALTKIMCNNNSVATGQAVRSKCYPLDVQYGNDLGVTWQEGRVFRAWTSSETNASQAGIQYFNGNANALYSGYTGYWQDVSRSDSTKQAICIED